MDGQVSDGDDLAMFVRDLVRTKLDLAEVESIYLGGRGRLAYDPTMMTALITDACCLGMHSSREIVEACRDSMP